MKILVLCPHADDHIATVGTIHKLMKKGAECKVIVFSVAEDSVPDGFSKDIVEKEFLMGMKLIGINDYEINHYQVREFFKRRREILEKFVVLRNEYNPDFVFVPTTYDMHQDHEIVCRESIRAFRFLSNIYGYIYPRNTNQSLMNRFEIISEDDLKMKIAIASCFKSQIGKSNSFLTGEYIRALAIEQGSRIDVKYAEGFEVIREVSK